MDGPDSQLGPGSVAAVRVLPGPGHQFTALMDRSLAQNYLQTLQIIKYYNFCIYLFRVVYVNLKVPQNIIEISPRGNLKYPYDKS